MFLRELHENLFVTTERISERQETKRKILRKIAGEEFSDIADAGDATNATTVVVMLQASKKS